MPVKNVREMNKLERQHYSLASRTFRATIIGSIILGLTALIIGLGLYAYALGGQYIGEAFNVSRHMAAVLEKYADAEPLADEVMQRYKNLSEEQRAGVDSESYKEGFSDIQERSDYIGIRELLAEFLKASDVYDVYIAMYDRDTCAMVYIVDPDDSADYTCTPGIWEGVNKKGMEKFLSWDGKGTLYDIAKTEKYGFLATSGVPLKNADGEIYAFVLADVSLENVIRGMNSFMLQYAAAMFIIVNVVALLMALNMKKKIVKPINAIADAAEKYINDRYNGTDETNHFSELKISTGDEVENLALIMADMERDLKEYEEHLTKVTAEKERVGTELALATRIQADMLPNIFPAFPERPEFDIYASMKPAKEVGGDFYDFFLVDDNHLALVIADVSGKGVPAALFMMVSKILVKNHTASGKSPKAVLEAVNTQICSNNREEMFVTAWLGILDIETGILTAANAGHEYPVLKKANGDFELVKDKHGFVIGGMAGTKYTEYQICLEPDSKLFVYTDGLKEATDREENLFGSERMLNVLNNAKDASPKDITEAIDREVELFADGADRFDDLTMLCLHYIGNGKSTKADERTFDAAVESIPEVTDFVNAELEKNFCSAKAVMQIDIAIDEIFSNIAKFAYAPEKGLATVRVETEKEPARVVITFIDNGKPYDPLSAADPDTTLSAEERQIGGMGVFLVKKTMDDVVYEYKDGQNILKIKKGV